MVPQHLRERAYLVIVRPALEYASAITDPHLSRDVKRLDSVQRHAARFVTNNPRRRYDPDEEQVSVTALLQDLGWEDLASRRTDARCSLMHKLLNCHVAVEEDLRPQVCTGRTRSAAQNKLKTTRSKTAVYGQSFFPRTTRDWNRPHVDARTASSPEDFKAALRQR